MSLEPGTGETGMSREQAMRCLELWMLWGQVLRMPCPVTSHGSGYEHDDDDGLKDACFRIVEAVLASYGKGIYAPTKLRALAIFVVNGGDLESFQLFGPGKGMPPEILGLGLRSRTLVGLAFEHLIRRIRLSAWPSKTKIFKNAETF